MKHITNGKDASEWTEKECGLAFRGGEIPISVHNM
jgi:hypothetical protein